MTNTRSKGKARWEQLIGISQKQLREILQKFEGKSIEVVVLIVERQISFAKVKTLSTKEGVEYFSAFIERTLSVIESHGGYVWGMGDCISVLFLPSKRSSEIPTEAVLCGLAVLDMIKNSLNPYLARRKLPSVDCRLSADFGIVKVVSIGATRPFDTEKTLQIFGSVLSNAQTMLKYTMKGQISIGENLFWKVDRDKFEIKLILDGEPERPLMYFVKSIK